MDLRETLKDLCRIEEPRGTLVTVAWDFSREAVYPKGPRNMLKKKLLSQLRGRDPGSEKALETLAAKILRTAEGELRPETKGLFLVAGPAMWTPIELAVPIRNFIHLGETAYLPPLLEAMARFPRAAVLRYDHREAVLQELELGQWGAAEHLLAPEVERDPEHAATGREGAIRTGGGWMRGGMGGGGRDRYERHFEEDAEGLLRRAAARVEELERNRPLAAVLAYGDHQHFPLFREALPAELRPRVFHAGATPHRDENAWKKAVQEDLERVAQKAGRSAVSEYRERQAQGCHVAAGPDHVIGALEPATMVWAILDSDDPVPGGKCPACGVLYRAPKRRCDSCAVKLAPRSVTQEVAARAILHPPLALTFVSDEERTWLRNLGGMAALLAVKGVRSKR
jgi:hypothetical protein